MQRFINGRIVCSIATYTYTYIRLRVTQLTVCTMQAALQFLTKIYKLPISVTKKPFFEENKTIFCNDPLLWFSRHYRTPCMHMLKLDFTCHLLSSVIAYLKFSNHFINLPTKQNSQIIWNNFATRCQELYESINNFRIDIKQSIVYKTEI